MKGFLRQIRKKAKKCEKAQLAVETLLNPCRIHAEKAHRVFWTSIVHWLHPFRPE
jgi:hypothetical protein